jgi:copper chaperone CopZ
MTTSTYLVDGMTCDHCVHAVGQELTALDGVSDITIDLRPGASSVVAVTSAAPLDPDSVRAAIDEAGYALVSGR